MDIKKYIADELIIKDAFIDRTLIWSSDKNTKSMVLIYKTFKYKNYRYYMNHIHHEDYYE